MAGGKLAMEEIQYPINGFNNAHEVIEESRRTGRQICDIIGRGLPADYTQEQLVEAHLQGECTEGYLAARLGIDRVAARRLSQERQIFQRFLKYEPYDEIARDYGMTLEQFRLIVVKQQQRIAKAKQERQG
jgi:hypothetical protein